MRNFTQKREIFEELNFAFFFQNGEKWRKIRNFTYKREIFES